MRKRRIAMLLGAAVIASILTGCSGKAPAGSAGTQAVSENSKEADSKAQAETEGKPDPSGKEVPIVERSVWGVGEGGERVLSPGSAVIWARPIPPAPRSTRAKTAAEAAHCRQCRGRPCRRGSGTTLGSAWI